MPSNIDRFRSDLDSLVARGQLLEWSMQRDSIGKKEFDAQAKKRLGEKAEDFIKRLPSFKATYQAWYSEALALLTQLLRVWPLLMFALRRDLMLYQ
jgi:hypothetical protein